MALLAASPAMAQGPGRRDRIVISGPVEVQPGETVDDVIVFQGSADVEGRVDGRLIVVDGPVQVSGRISDGLVALTGPVTLEPGARVEGGLVHGGSLDAQPGSVVVGDTKDVGEGLRGGDLSEGFWFAGRSALWLGVTISTFLLGLLILLLAPGAPAILSPLARSRPAPALGWGLLMFFGLPVAVLLCFLSVVGIPLGVVLLLGLPLFYLSGYVVSAAILGVNLLRSSPQRRILAFCAGLGALRILALIPMLAGLIWFGATAFGLGAVAVGVSKSRKPAAPPAAPDPAGTPA